MAAPVIIAKVATVVVPFLKKHPYFLPTLIVAIIAPVVFLILTVVGIVNGVSGIQLTTPASTCSTQKDLGGIFESWNSDITVGTGLEGTTVACAGDGSWVAPIELIHPISDFYGLRWFQWGCGNVPVPCLHEGVDIAAPSGTPIYAASSGVVLQAGDNGTCGNSVFIEHADKVYTLYCHIRYKADGTPDILVKKGDSVSAGQHIAGVGTTGNSGGDHLHFVVMIGSLNFKRDSVDPLLFLGQKGIDLSQLRTGLGDTENGRRYCNPNQYNFSWC